MSQEKNEGPKPGGGLFASLKIIVAIVVMIIAGGAILLVLDMISLETFQLLAVKTALVGGVSAVAGLVLGLLARSRH
jgi:hypothetical protein